MTLTFVWFVRMASRGRHLWLLEAVERDVRLQRADAAELYSAVEADVDEGWKREDGDEEVGDTRAGSGKMRMRAGGGKMGMRAGKGRWG